MYIETKTLQNNTVLQQPNQIAGIEGTTVTMPNGAAIHVTKYNDVWMTDGSGNLFPLSDPAAEALVSAQSRWMIRWIPRSIVIGIALACFVVMSVWALDPYPATQEAALAIHSMLSIWSVRLIGALATGLSLYVFVTVLMTGRAKTKPVFYAPNMRNGLCLVTDRTDNDDTVAARLEQVRAMFAAEQGGVRAILFIKYQDPIAYFWNADTPDRLPQFDRSEGSKKWDLPEEYTGSTFANETWEQYQAYCAAVEPLIRNQWLKAAHQKGTNPEAASQNLGNMLRYTCLLLAIMSLPIFGFAQKSKQVETYLGSDRYTMDLPVGKVKYIFSKAVLERTGDGKFSHKQLLPNAMSYTDDSNAGALLSITVRGERLLPVRATNSQPVTTTTTTPVQQRTGATAIDPVRPRPLFNPEQQQPGATPVGAFMLPDSNQLAAGVENIKRNYDNLSGRIKSAFGQVWSAVMWVFWSISVMLLGILGICRYIAKSAANESLVSIKGKALVGKWIVSAQQNAAGFTLIITWMIVIIILIDIFLIIVHFLLPLWALIPLWFFILHIADRITDWLVPNLKVAKQEYK